MNGVFDAYSRYYDLLYRDKDYGAEAAYVASFLKRYAPSARRLLELGCGTGAHAEHFARMGYSVHGIDQSETMLARAEARKVGLPAELAARLSFGPGDVRTVRAGEHYDAVVSLFHVMSYQATDADLRAAFATAATHLRPGGLFLFDFWYGPAVLAQRPESRVKHLEDERIRVTRVAEPMLHEDGCVVDVNYHVTIDDRLSGEVQELRETHSMRYLFLPELARLRSSMFEERASLAWMSESAPDAQSWSALQILERTGP